MNIHIPQCIQTVSELLLICNATKRFVSPASSNIAISVKQDTLMGSYLQTYDTIRIDWKDAMNILMATSVGLNADIPKNSLLSGKYVYSQIVPKNINIIRTNDKGEFDTRIQNGTITHGLLGKDEIKNIIKNSWFQ